MPLAFLHAIINKKFECENQANGTVRFCERWFVVLFRFCASTIPAVSTPMFTFKELLYVSEHVYLGNADLASDKEELDRKKISAIVNGILKLYNFSVLFFRSHPKLYSYVGCSTEISKFN